MLMDMKNRNCGVTPSNIINGNLFISKFSSGQLCIAVKAFFVHLQGISYAHDERIIVAISPLEHEGKLGPGVFSIDALDGRRVQDVTLQYRFSYSLDRKDVLDDLPILGDGSSLGAIFVTHNGIFLGISNNVDHAEQIKFYDSCPISYLNISTGEIVTPKKIDTTNACATKVWSLVDDTQTVFSYSS